SGDVRKSVAAENCSGARSSALNDGEVITALRAGVQHVVNEVDAIEGVEASRVRAVAGGCLIGGLRAVDGAERRLGRTFISGTAGSEKIGDSDSGDNADNRNDDEKFDQRKAFLAFGIHSSSVLLKKI